MAIDAPPRVGERPAPVHCPPEPEPPLVFREMSFEDYLRLPEKPKAEWLDGVAVIHMAPPQYPHFRINGQLIAALVIALPGLVVGSEAPVQVDGRLLVPDIAAVVPQPKGTKWVDQPPIIVVEVLSPSTRKYDLSTKLTAYLEAGVGQYWTVDTDLGEIVVRRNDGQAWTEVARLDEAHRVVTVEVADHGAVELDRNRLFG